MISIDAIGEIDLFDITSWPSWFRWVVALFMFLMLIVGGVRLLITPIAAQIESAQVQEKNLKNAIAKEESFAIVLSEQRRRTQAAKRELDSAIVIINNEEPLRNRLGELSQIGVEIGVEFEQFKPGSREDVTPYRIDSLEIMVSGDYGRLRNFIDRVLGMPGLILVDDFAITKNDSNLTMELKLLGYHYMDSVEVDGRDK